MEDTFVIKHIRELCKQREMSFYKLAKLSKIPHSTLNTMLKKQHVPSMNNLIKICNGLGITLSQFFSENEENKNLTQEQKEILSLWNLLDINNKMFIKGYLYGLTHKTPPILPITTGDENNDI